MAVNVIDGDLTVRGTLAPTALNAPAGCIGDTQASGSSPLGVTKTTHRHVRTLAQVHGSAASAERRAVHRAHAAGTVAAVRVGVVVACIGDSTITVDVQKNGTTILSAPVVIDNANAAYAVEAGSVSVAAYVADDVFEVLVTVSAGTGTLGQGLTVDLILSEAAG